MLAVALHFAIAALIGSRVMLRQGGVIVMLGRIEQRAQSIVMAVQVLAQFGARRPGQGDDQQQNQQGAQFLHGASIRLGCRAC